MARFVLVVALVCLALAVAPTDGKGIGKRVWRAVRHPFKDTTASEPSALARSTSDSDLHEIAKPRTRLTVSAGADLGPSSKGKAKYSGEFAGLADISSADISQCMATKEMQDLFTSQDMIRGGNIGAHEGSLMLHHFWTTYALQHFLEGKVSKPERIYTDGLPKVLRTVAPAIAIIHDVGKVDPAMKYPSDPTKVQDHLDKPHDEHGRDMLLGQLNYLLPSGEVNLHKYLQDACPTVYTNELLQLAALVVAVHWKVGIVQTNRNLATPAARAQAYVDIFAHEAKTCSVDLTQYTAAEKRHLLQLCTAITAADVKGGRHVAPPASNVVGDPPAPGNLVGKALDNYAMFGYLGDNKAGANIPELVKAILKIKL